MSQVLQNGAVLGSGLEEQPIYCYFWLERNLEGERVGLAALMGGDCRLLLDVLPEKNYLLDDKDQPGNCGLFSLSADFYGVLTGLEDSVAEIDLEPLIVVFVGQQTDDFEQEGSRLEGERLLVDEGLFVVKVN